MHNLAKNVTIYSRNKVDEWKISYLIYFYIKVKVATIKYIYILKNQLNDLGYEYHILGPNKNNELVDKQIPNIIQIFENNDISIKKITKDNNNPEFLKFLDYYRKSNQEIEKGKKR